MMPLMSDYVQLPYAGYGGGYGGWGPTDINASGLNFVFAAMHAWVAWWAWNNRRAPKPAWPMYLTAGVSAFNALTLAGVNLIPRGVQAS
jgi:hypothetical protein